MSKSRSGGSWSWTSPRGTVSVAVSVHGAELSPLSILGVGRFTVALDEMRLALAAALQLTTYLSQRATWEAGR